MSFEIRQEGDPCLRKQCAATIEKQSCLSQQTDVFETQKTAMYETSLSASHCGALCLSTPSFLCYTYRRWVIGQDTHHLKGEAQPQKTYAKTISACPDLVRRTPEL